MPYYSPDMIMKARELDLLTYLQMYEPDELVHITGTTYCTRTHDSLKISNGKWNWFSHGFGGKSALDYLIQVNGMTFVQAMERVLEVLSISPTTPTSTPKMPVQKDKTLLLPAINENTDHGIRYLKSRGIDEELIDLCISTGRFYESYPYHSAVFVGMDIQHVPRYATIRGIGNSFIGEAEGSDKRYSFSIPSESDTVCLFESAIDLLSFATLLKQCNRPWNEHHLVSLAGVYRPAKELKDSSFPLVLKQYFADHPGIRNVQLCLDNDATGKYCAAALSEMLKSRYGIRAVNRFPPQGKDYNDYLCDRLELPRTVRKPFGQAR